MSEQARLDFLLNRDGIDGAVRFYKQAVAVYRQAVDAALKPMAPEEVKTPARGREWASVYRKSVIECEAVLRGLELRQEASEMTQEELEEAKKQARGRLNLAIRTGDKGEADHWALVLTNLIEETKDANEKTA